MDPESKQLLEENLRLSKENNELLLKIYKIQRWAQITRVLYWVVIILISLGAFYFIKPMMNNLINVYTGGISEIQNISGMTKSLEGQDEINRLLKELGQ